MRRASGSDGGIEPGHDALAGQRLHDHARRKRQNLLRRDAQALRQRLAGAARPRQAIGTGAGVGIARVDQQGPNLPARRQMRLAHLHRRGAKAVGGKGRAHTGALVQQKHRQVLAVRLADTGLHHADAHTGNGEKLGGVGGR